jgi:hypothetical protein
MQKVQGAIVAGHANQSARKELEIALISAD